MPLEHISIQRQGISDQTARRNMTENNLILHNTLLSKGMTGISMFSPPTILGAQSIYQTDFIITKTTKASQMCVQYAFFQNTKSPPINLRPLY